MFRMLAIPVAIQWLLNFAQALLWIEGLGCSQEACSALSCSYCTRAATCCLTALSMCYCAYSWCLGVARIVPSCGPCSASVVRHVHSGARFIRFYRPRDGTVLSGSAHCAGKACGLGGGTQGQRTN